MDRFLVMQGELFFDSGRDGATNMAIDQAMLQRASREGIALLRIYRWSPATLSLGYFQNFKDVASHAPSAQIAWVRRSSGGGAIIHHHDWTYALAMPLSSSDSQVGASQELYTLIHQEIALWLKRFGLTVELFQSTGIQSTGIQSAGNQSASSSTSDHGPTIDPKAYLCFQRRSVGDLVCGGYKILGSAQRRFGGAGLNSSGAVPGSSGAVLQHGSLLLARSIHAPELPGIAELSGNGEAVNCRASDAVATEADESFSQSWCISPDSTENVRQCQLWGEAIANVLQRRFGIQWKPRSADWDLNDSDTREHRERFDSVSWREKH